MPTIRATRTWPPRLSLVAANSFALLTLCAFVAHPRIAIAIDSETISYNRDIRPILAENCFACHGPDSASRKAGLRLDRRDDAVEKGAIAPGKPGESALIARIFATDPDDVMPPPHTQKTLSTEQKERLRQWIEAGAEYQAHWSFLPPKRPPLPEVANADWIKNPIDAFILARLEAEGLSPAPEADRRTLARRAALDLTGLPPTPEIVEAFVSDSSPNAYETLVDRLLDSVHWGEHRARYWLDYARYADTHGIHFDNYREMWSYRDWVIQAFNENRSYDRFTIENLAGDLLPNATLDQIVGSGFNRCNMTTNEGGIIDEEYRVLYTRDRTETTSTVWLGLTANCSVCHDHKFDPLSQREFYEMSAFFNNTTQGARDGNIKDTPPIVFVPLREDRDRWEELARLIPSAKEKIESRRRSAREEFAAWLATTTPETEIAKVSVEGLHFEAGFDEGSGREVNVLVVGSSHKVRLAPTAQWKEGALGSKALDVRGAALEVSDAGDFERDQPFTLSARVLLPGENQAGAICARMDNTQSYRGWDFWVENRRAGSHIISSWPNDALKVVAKAQIPVNRWTHVTVAYDGSGKASGVRIYYDGVAQETQVLADRLQGSIRTAVPLKVGQRHTSEGLRATIQDFRIYTRALAAVEVASLAGTSRANAILAKPVEERTEAEKDSLYTWWLEMVDETHRALRGDLRELEAEEARIRTRGTVAHVMQERSEPAHAYILFRGEYDKRRDRVEADTPDILPPFPDEFPRNRLGFAKWLLLDDHPLTARVTVNRFWQEVFGTGIVRTTGDFGISGELPMHPELLDWLAVDFRENGWDVKRLFKLFVTSATYRQSATVTPEKIEKDPENRLLSRGPRFRMDAEMIRDYALQASGLLVRDIGGPSVKPYQPPGVWEAIAMNVSNTREYVRDAGENLYRRSLYTFWKRMAPPASMEILNAPNREFCVVRRDRTNTPLQALVTLNDEQFIEAARHLAQTAIRQGDTFEERLRIVGLRLVARPFRPEEVEVIRASLDSLLAYYEAHSDDAAEVISVGESAADPGMAPAELAAWTLLSNQLFNLDEVLNK